MYSPKVREDLIPRLYRLRVARKTPMTVLVNEAVETFLAREEQPANDKAPTLSKVN